MMRNAIGFSVFLHTAVFVVGYFGLPYLQPVSVLSDTPIMLELVNVAKKTNAPLLTPKIDKKTKSKKEELPKKNLSPQKKKAQPLPPKAKEVLSLSPKPKPKPKPKLKLKPKPKLKTQSEKKKFKAVRQLSKVKPRRKPKPPDAFASVLKTVEKLKTQSKQKDNKKNNKKIESFEQQMSQALASQIKNHNPLQKLAISEIDLVRQQIKECWSLPAGAREAEDLRIEIKMVMNSDGSVRQARILDQGRLQSDPFFRAAAESALRAVLNPRCNPLKLPRKKYNQWQDITLIFDPQKMF